MTKRKKIVAGVVMAVVLGLSVSAVAQSEPPPPPPPWVNEDGTTDPSKVPARVGVVDQAGKPVGWTNGSDLFAPPPGPNSEPGQRSVSPPVYNEAGEVIGRLTPNGFVRTKE